MTNREAIGELSALMTREPGFAAAIDMAIKALETRQWIPRSKRLPEEDGDYLVTYEEGYREDYSLDEIGIAPFDTDCEGFGIWQEHFDNYTLGSLGNDFVDIPVTAWMPLPEPYKEGE